MTWRAPRGPGGRWAPIYPRREPPPPPPPRCESCASWRPNGHRGETTHARCALAPLWTWWDQVCAQYGACNDPPDLSIPRPGAGDYGGPPHLSLW